MTKIMSLISLVAVFGCKKNTEQRDTGPIFVSTSELKDEAPEPKTTQSMASGESPAWCGRLGVGFKWEGKKCFQDRNSIEIRATPADTPNLDKRFNVEVWEVALVDITSGQNVSQKGWAIKASVQNMTSQPFNCRFGLIAQVDSIAPGVVRCSIATPGMGAETSVGPGQSTQLSDFNEACHSNQTFWGPESRASVVVMCAGESRVLFVPYSINWP